MSARSVDVAVGELLLGRVADADDGDVEVERCASQRMVGVDGDGFVFCDGHAPPSSGTSMRQFRQGAKHLQPGKSRAVADETASGAMAPQASVGDGRRMLAMILSHSRTSCFTERSPARLAL